MYLIGKYVNFVVRSSPQEVANKMARIADFLQGFTGRILPPLERRRTTYAESGNILSNMIGSITGN